MSKSSERRPIQAHSLVNTKDKCSLSTTTHDFLERFSTFSIHELASSKENLLSCHKVSPPFCLCARRYIFAKACRMIVGDQEFADHSQWDHQVASGGYRTVWIHEGLRVLCPIRQSVEESFSAGSKAAVRGSLWYSRTSSPPRWNCWLVQTDPRPSPLGLKILYAPRFWSHSVWDTCSPKLIFTRSQSKKWKLAVVRSGQSPLRTQLRNPKRRSRQRLSYKSCTLSYWTLGKSWAFQPLLRTLLWAYF